MSLKSSLRRVFANEEGLYDLSTTDMDKTIEFAKGDFKRFNTGGGVADRYSSYGAYGTSNEFASSQSAKNSPSYQQYAMSSQGKRNVQRSTPQSFLSYSQPIETMRYQDVPTRTPNYTPSQIMAAQQARYERDREFNKGRTTPSSSFADKINLTEKVNNFIQNLKDYYKKGGEGGSPELGAPPPPKGSSVRARASAAAQFRKGQAGNSPITSQMAKFFDPKINSEFAKFLMANMGTSSVNTKGLASFTDRISVRKPRYYSNVVNPNTPTFTLPTRTT